MTEETGGITYKEGANVRLRPWKETDLPVLIDVRNDVALQAQLLARVRGSNAEQVRAWLQGRASREDQLLLIVADRETDEPLGFVQVVNIDAIDGRGDLGICLIAKAQGRGIGTEVVQLFCDHLRDNLRLRKLNLQVRADNAAAIRCYEKVGFYICGHLKEHVFIEEAWHDVTLMERFLAAEN